MKKTLLGSFILASIFTSVNAMLPNAYTVNGTSLGVPQAGSEQIVSVVQGQTIQNTNLVAINMSNDTSVLSYGSRGETVKDLQRNLNKKGAKLPVTGYYGKMTRAAVAKYGVN